MALKFLRKNSLHSIWKKRTRKPINTSIVSKDNEYIDYVVSKKAVSVFNDTDFSLDTFLAEFAKLRVESISQIPDKCLIEIVKRLPIKDVLNLRLVNHRLNDIVQRNYENFSKLYKNSLCLIGSNTGKIARFNPFSYRRHSTPTQTMHTHELEIPQIDRPLRHFRSQAVTIEHVKVNNIVWHALQRSFKYKFRQLDFSYCSLNVNNPAEFAYFIRGWNIRELTFSHCSWPQNIDTTPICDKIFEFNPQLQHVSISFEKITDIKITNLTLKKWAACTTWPRSFILHNAKSEISHEGIGAAISSYCSVAQAKTKREKVLGSTILWNFGIVNTSVEWLAREMLPLKPYVRYLKQIPHGLHLKIQVTPTFPALHVRMAFSYRNLRVLKKNISLPTL